VPGVTWLPWEEERHTLDAWCESVGPPVVSPGPERTGEVSRLLVVSWNVHVGGGDVEELMSELGGSPDGTGLVFLLQETFRAGVEVPESYPRGLRVPSSIRPDRPTLDVVGLAERFGLSVAYVPSMRNGSATEVETREDRGNAVLSTEPLSDIRAIELPFGKQRRVSLAATVTPRGATPLRVVVAHLDPSGDRVPQAEALSGRIAMLDELPLILGGDLNSRRGFADDAVAAVSRQVHLESCGTGRTHRWPLRLDLPLFFFVGRLDHVFSTLAVDVPRTCQTLDDAYGSDHVPIVLDVRVSPPSSLFQEQVLRDLADDELRAVDDFSRVEVDADARE
jgi:endonuclease/exonuclease/phosphatase family metal-dependent hydrolase